MLAEAELDLLQADSLPEDIVESLRVIHTAALRMRTLLREPPPN